MKRMRVAVALSGGVDSAVSAALLQREGYAVIGLFGKTWTSQPGDGTVCTWVAERRDALRVAAHLAIPLVTVDCEDLYRRAVINPMIEGYRTATTPNPDVLCNRVVKFGALFEKAQALGAELFATGHYARIAMRAANGEWRMANDKPKSKHHSNSLLAPRSSLLRGVDPTKDQSYFLWDIQADVLPFVRFPIGHLTKTAVRALAVQFGLPVAAKKDSQGICFLGPTDLPAFLARQLPDRPGLIRDWESGEILGEHRGVHLFTIGQRHGFGQSFSSRSFGAARYVVARDARQRTLWLGPAAALLTDGLTIGHCNWLADETVGQIRACAMQIRYHGAIVPAHLTKETATTIRVQTNLPVRAPAVGQSVVFYRNAVVLGGGIITRTAITRHHQKKIPVAQGAGGWQ
ncbi:tRNA 2-thiouridine(34) synthase MnmA [Candidatus Berkelbacteria bacterium]|nr:tRNA 2-thiouridine(34) synthase MnmA [Candidatus Berkelbacteria bacterium]